MRDEKEERKKQARSNKQTGQSNTAHVHIQNFTKINLREAKFENIFLGGDDPRPPYNYVLR